MKICQICNKSPKTGYSRSHSYRQIKRIIKPNIQKISLVCFSSSKTKGKYICTRCLKTAIKHQLKKD